MPTHKLTLAYDDAAGTVRATHRTTVAIGGHAISHAEDVALSDHDGAAAALKALVDGNREEMEKRATALALIHAAALAGKAPKNTKQLVIGGTLGAVGGADAKKAE